jgi:hypothetical protein
MVKVKKSGIVLGLTREASMKFLSRGYGIVADNSI